MVCRQVSHKGCWFVQYPSSALQIENVVFWILKIQSKKIQSRAKRNESSPIRRALLDYINVFTCFIGWSGCHTSHRTCQCQVKSYRTWDFISIRVFGNNNNITTTTTRLILMIIISSIVPSIDFLALLHIAYCAFRKRNFPR